MPKASPRASAHRFAVVSHTRCANLYTGTREQLIALGVARPEQFPEGRKRLKWDYSNLPEKGWSITKLKGGIFELREEHGRYRSGKNYRDDETVYFEVKLKKNEAGYTPWVIIGADLEGRLSSGYSYRSLAEAANLIADTIKYEQYQAKRSCLQLVKSTGTTGGK